MSDFQDNAPVQLKPIKACAQIIAERDRYREALEWITRNLTDACTDLKCEGCKLTIQEVIHRATNALKGA